MASLTTNGIRFAVGDELNSKRGIFPTSTAWVFYQSSAPTGWTRLTDHTNKALRVVSGTGGGSNGTNAFTTTMSSFVIGGALTASDGSGGLSLTTPQIASHDHPNGGEIGLSANGQLFNPAGGFIGWGGGDVARPTGDTTNLIWTRTAPGQGGTGNGDSHSHPVSGSGTVPNQTVNISVQYIDVIICTFNG